MVVFPLGISVKIAFYLGRLQMTPVNSSRTEIPNNYGQDFGTIKQGNKPWLLKRLSPKRLTVINEIEVPRKKLN